MFVKFSRKKKKKKERILKIMGKFNYFDTKDNSHAYLHTV